jgi:MFS family permease
MESDPAVPARTTPADRTGWTHRTFASLRVRNFRLFVGGQLLSNTGTWAQYVAAPLLVYHLTGSGVALGIDTGLSFLPILLFGAWGGVVADRLDNRRVQILTQAVYALLAFTLWALVATGVVHVWMVYLLSFLSGMVTAVDMPTRQSFYLEMVGPSDLTNAMSLNTATFTCARIIGPVIAAVMIAATGGNTAPVFLVNGISYLAVILALFAIRVPELHPREHVARAKGQIREGLAYIGRTPDLRLPMLVMGFVFLFAFNFAVLLPLFALRTFGGDAGTFGAMLSLFGFGSLAGALFLAARSSRPNPGRLCLFALALGGASIALAAAPDLPLVWVLLPALGFVGTAFAITGNSTLQLTSAPQLRGRVMAIYTVIFLGSTPIGAPLAGWVGQHLGARAGLLGGGVIALAAGVGGLVALGRRRDALMVAGSSA